MATGRPPLASVDEVREELRRLGYLDRGIDRFVLSGALSVSPLQASLRAASRVGLAGGALFGTMLTLAAAGLNRRLLAEPRDLAVLALYLTLALSAIVFVLAFLLGLLAGALGRRLGRDPAPSVARNAGLALAAVGVLYLGFWWKSHALGAGAGVQAALVVLGLLGSAALMRFGTLAAVAVLSAGGGRLPQASLSAPQILPLLGAAVVLLAGGMALATHGTSAASPAPDFAVVPTGLRLHVVGIDGFELRMATELAQRGELPNFSRWRASGAFAILRAEPEQVPAIVWTTIATGRGPEAHGIQAVGARRLAGMQTPVGIGADGRFARTLGAATDLLRLTRTEPASAFLRGSKAFWNVASDKGLRVGVVNWWATWPAEPLNGFLVTDRAFFKAEKGEAADREVYPPEAFPRVAACLPKGGERSERMDHFHVAALAALGADHRVDLEALYLSGLDIATMQQLGEASVYDLSSLERRLSAVRAYYVEVDRLLGAIGQGWNQDDVLVLVGDPGRLARRAPGPAEGMLVLAGGPIAAGDLGIASERDIAPTILHLLGLPISRELEGRVLLAALGATFAGGHPMRSVSSYGEAPHGRAAESAFDPEMLEELRSLGYIK